MSYSQLASHNSTLVEDFVVLTIRVVRSLTRQWEWDKVIPSAHTQRREVQKSISSLWLV